MADKNKNKTITAPAKEFNLWKVYSICLLISTIFFFLFGFNSPIYKFNSDPDYHYFMTLGNALLHGKIPYRDLFEQKGPIVYFVYGFCCIFPSPRLAILIIEIICMSFFFFFTYQISKMFLNTFYALISIPILAFITFAAWNRVSNASCIEEFCLPIITYFFYTWIDFLLNKKSWPWPRNVCIGICIGIILWSKYTILYFILPPIIIWLIMNLQKSKFRQVIINSLFMLIGIVLISIPNIIFYSIHNAFDDLLNIYIFTNIKHFNKVTPIFLIDSFKNFFKFNPIIVILLTYGLGRFVINHWKKFKVIIFSFLITFALLIITSYYLNYYFNILIPYAILSIIEILESISSKTKINKHKFKFFCIIILSSIILVLPISIFPREISRKRNDYTPLVIGDIIKNYEYEHQINATLFCYKIPDLGIYNVTKKVPNNYFFVDFTIKTPDILLTNENAIKNQNSDFVITKFYTWIEEEKFISQYYEPLTGNERSSSFHYYKLRYFEYVYYDLILLKKI